MPFDPSLPAPNSPLEFQVIRDQLQALFLLINNIVSVTAAQVTSVNTLPPSSPANAIVSVVGNTLHFTFEIPQGQEGPMGQQGPPFANAFVDAVNTVGPGDPASVGVNFDGSNVRFTFDIPRGNDGSQRPAGNDGGQGPPGNDGAQGPPFAQAIVDKLRQLAEIDLDGDKKPERLVSVTLPGADEDAGPAFAAIYLVPAQAEARPRKLKGEPGAGVQYTILGPLDLDADGRPELWLNSYDDEGSSWSIEQVGSAELTELGRVRVRGLRSTPP